MKRKRRLSACREADLNVSIEAGKQIEIGEAEAAHILFLTFLQPKQPCANGPGVFLARLLAAAVGQAPGRGGCRARRRTAHPVPSASRRRSGPPALYRALQFLPCTSDDPEDAKSMIWPS